MDQTQMSRREAVAKLTAPSAAFVVTSAMAHEHSLRVYRHTPTLMREVLTDSPEHGNRMFLVMGETRWTFSDFGALSYPGFDALLIQWLSGWRSETVVMVRPSRYTPELRRRAVEEVLDRGRKVTEVAGSLSITSPETLRRWVIQAKFDRGLVTGPTTEELAEIESLRKEVADQQRTVEIL